ncbi:phosphopantetheine-binding protein [Embleya sp. NPDC055664]
MTGPKSPAPQARRRALRSVLRRIDREARGREFTEPRPEGADVPLTLDQEWLYTAASAVPDLAGMAVTGRLETEHRPDHARLRDAVETVAAATPALGLLVEERGGTLVQVPGSGTRVRWHDTPDEPAWSAPFDPRHGPLCRAAIGSSDTGCALTLAVARHSIDRTSMGLLLAAVADAYRDGTVPPTGGFGVADHAYWHRRRFSPERLAELLPTAAERLGPARPSLLPYDRPPVVGPASAAGASLSRRVPAPAEPRVALLAAVGAALRRFGAASPLRLGLDDPGRHTPQTAELVGRLGTVGVLPLRIDGGVDAAALTPRAREAIAACERAPLPLAALADLRPQTWEAEPLLPVGLDTVSLPVPHPGDGPARIRLLPSPVPMYGLEFVLAVDGDESELLTEYDPDLFDPTTIDALATLVAHFLDPAASGTPTPLTAPAIPRERALGDTGLLTGWAARPTDDVLITTRRGELAGARVVAAVRAIRAALAEAGARDGDTVVLAADDSADSAAALLGALDFGADVLVRNADDPAAWSDAVATAAHARFELLPDGTVDHVAQRPESAPCARTAEASTGDDADAPHDPPGALLVGLRARPTPRVLRIPSSALLRAADRLADALGTAVSDVFAPDFAWGGEDAAICVLAAARAGATLLLPAGAEPADARFDALSEAGATVAELPFSFAESVPVHLLELRAAYRRLTEPASPGEGRDAAPRRRWWAPAVPDALLTGPDPHASTCATPYHVLNDDLLPVPVGGTGTLWATVEPGTGYLDEPAVCAADFRPDPVGGGGRIANTRALVRVGADGTLRLVRPPDDRVCVRGRSILLADLTATLAQETGRPAVAGAQPLGWGRAERPYAAIGAGGDRTPTSEDLPDRLRRLVPGAAVPETVFVIENTEIAGRTEPTHTATLARAARSAAERAARLDARPYTPPATDTERALARDVLVPVLGVARVGRDDNFFGLGGTSLQLIQVLARVHAAHGVDVALADVFAAPTLRRLAESLDHARAVESRDLDTIDELLTTVEDALDDAPTDPTRLS